MRVPDVADWVKGAPVRLLRNVFAGVGQVLLATDQLRESEPGATTQLAPPPEQPEQTDPLTAAQAQRDGAQPAQRAGAQPAQRGGDQPAQRGGHVRLLTPDEVAARPTTGAQQRTAAPRQPAQAGYANPPLPGYDELSLPSLRARLRNLDADQLRAVIGYERSHAARPDVITMFERRIAKLGE